MYFSTQACPAAGRETFKLRPGFFCPGHVSVGPVSGVVSSLIDSLTEDDHVPRTLLAAIAHFILQRSAGLATARLALRAVDSADAVSLNDAWEPQ